MARSEKGDHVKIEVADQESGDSEWMWLILDRDDDQQQLVLGQSDSDSGVVSDMKQASCSQ
jgi:hypothetical protein